MIILCQCLFLDFDNVLGLLPLGKTGQRVHGNSILFLHLLESNYFQIKSYFKIVNIHGYLPDGHLYGPKTYKNLFLELYPLNTVLGDFWCYGKIIQRLRVWLTDMLARDRLVHWPKAERLTWLLPNRWYLSHLKKALMTQGNVHGNIGFTRTQVVMGHPIVQGREIYFRDLRHLVSGKAFCLWGTLFHLAFPKFKF